MELILNNEKYDKQTENTEQLFCDLVNLREQLFKQVMNNNLIHNHKKFKNIISNSLCDFIINESEKFALKNITSKNPTGWTTSRPKNYPIIDLPIKEIPNLSNLLNNIIRYNIFPLIESSYNINKYFLNCIDIFIVRYKDNEQTELKRHKDGCAFSFNILLNHETEFENGGTIIFENGKDNLIIRNIFNIDVLKSKKSEYSKRIVKTFDILRKLTDKQLVNNHHTKILRKSTLKYVEHEFPTLLSQMREHKFRNSDSIQYLFFVINIDNIFFDNIIINKPSDVIEYHFANDLCERVYYKFDITKKYKFACFNSMNLTYKDIFYKYISHFV